MVVIGFGLVVVGGVRLLIGGGLWVGYRSRWVNCADMGSLWGVSAVWAAVVGVCSGRYGRFPLRVIA